MSGVQDDIARGLLDAASVDAREHALDFSEHYALKVDGQKFDRERYKHLIPLYEDDSDDVTVMAAAQTGKTAWLMHKLLRDATLHWGGLFGFYFPTIDLPKKYGRERWQPFVKSSPRLARFFGKSEDGGPGANGMLTTSFGPSTLYFMTTAGKTSTEGVPLRGVYFDEVRRMEPGDIQRAEERTSAQRDPINVKISTASFPESTICTSFKRGDQRYFHTACECPEGVVLSTTFPNCIADMRKATPELRRKVEHAHRFDDRGVREETKKRWGEAAYVCPTCGTIITDPREGWWEPHNPGAYARSWQMPQLLSWTYPASRALAKWNRQEDTQIDLAEVYWSLLGLPYVPPEAMPLRLEHLEAAVDPDAKWAARMLERERFATYPVTSMGFDVQAGYNVAVIKAMDPDGRFRTVHLEIVEGEDPWEECARLMHRFRVRICIADAQPEYGPAHRFAKAYEGRVWLAYYNTKEETPLVNWRDLPTPGPGQKGEETKFKWRVSLNRTKALQWEVDRWVRGLNTTPPPSGLVQELPVQGGKVALTAGLRVGQRQPVAICKDVYWPHLLGVAFIRHSTEEDKKIGKYTIRAEHVGLDPHFLHASTYASVALARLGHPAHPRTPDAGY